MPVFFFFFFLNKSSTISFRKSFRYLSVYFTSSSKFTYSILVDEEERHAKSEDAEYVRTVVLCEQDDEFLQKVSAILFLKKILKIRIFIFRLVSAWCAAQSVGGRKARWSLVQIALRPITLTALDSMIKYVLLAKVTKQKKSQKKKIGKHTHT